MSYREESRAANVSSLPAFLHQATVAAIVVGGLLLGVGGCAAPPIPKDAVYNDVRIASRSTAWLVAQQITSQSSFLGDKPIQVGPVVNAQSGEISRSGRDMQTFLLLDMKGMLENQVVERLGLQESEPGWVVTATTHYDKPDPKKPDESWFIVQLTTTNQQGDTMPPAFFRINARQFDPTPSKFFQMSPIYLTDRYHQERVQLDKAPKTNEARQARKRFIQIDSIIQEAIVLYEAGNFENSNRLFNRVSKDAPDNLSALSGSYQSLIAMKRHDEANTVLAQMIDAGIGLGNLSFRFLFRVHSTGFRDDMEIAAQYPMWLKQIARRLQPTKKCLQIKGHASRTGTAEYNDTLSRQRAERVVRELLLHEPKLQGRLSSLGMGFRENIVGSGSDDATDAIDRRVDFTLVDCKN